MTGNEIIGVVILQHMAIPGGRSYGVMKKSGLKVGTQTQSPLLYALFIHINVISFPGLVENGLTQALFSLFSKSLINTWFDLLK